LKKLLLAVLLLMVAGFLIYFFYPAKAVSLIVNEKQIELDNPVIIEEEILFVPAKTILEELGAYTRWDSSNKVLSGVLGDFQIELPVDSKDIIIDGETETWNKAVKIFDDVVYTPVTPTAEAFGAFVDWNEENRKIIVSTPQEFDPERQNDREGPLLHVAYPPEQQINYYADSLFVFGTTRSYAQIDVTVNGKPVEVLDRRTGNFLALVDIPRGEEFPIKVEASDGFETTTVERSVIFPEGLKTMPEEPLELHPSHVLPRQDQVLKPGDTLQIVVRGSPGAKAQYRIGKGSYFEMTELGYPTGQPGKGGIYASTYRVSDYDAPASGLSEAMPITVTLRKEEEQVSLELPGTVTFLSSTPFKVLEVLARPELKYGGWFRIIRDDYYQLYADTRGGTGYPDNVASYLTAGTRFEAVGASGDYYRVKLEEDEIYLLHKDAVRELENKGSLEPTLYELELAESRKKVSLRLNADERFPFLIESGKNQLKIRLYGINKDQALSIPELTTSVNALSLKPVAAEPNVFVLNVELEKDFTGYNPYWEDNDLVLDIRKPPEITKESPLKDKTIVIDPGHGGEDPGAPGPGDLDEKDVVLNMSLYLKDLLLEEGANVILTRTEDIFVDLYDRPKTKHLADTDFFISVHCNAHAQGADAINLHGIMTLYNYDHNEKLANIMLETLADEMGLPAMSTWRRNIAVTRFTQFPSVLVEAGYMMHPEDNWHILHPRGQMEFARAMKKGIIEYFLSFD